MLAHAVAVRAGRGNGFAFRVDAYVKYGGSNGAWGGDKTLDLTGPPVALLQPAGQFAHVVIRAAGEGPTTLLRMHKKFHKLRLF